MQSSSIDPSSASADMLDVVMAMTLEPKKPKLEDVLLSEWLIANARSMNTLFKHMVPSAIQDYWSYTIKAGGLLHDHEEDHLQVFQYDQQLQSRHAFRWGVDIPHFSKIKIKEVHSSTTNTHGKKHR